MLDEGENITQIEEFPEADRIYDVPLHRLDRFFYRSIHDFINNNPNHLLPEQVKKKEIERADLLQQILSFERGEEALLLLEKLKQMTNDIADRDIDLLFTDPKKAIEYEALRMEYIKKIDVQLSSIGSKEEIISLFVKIQEIDSLLESKKLSDKDRLLLLDLADSFKKGKVRTSKVDFVAGLACLGLGYFTYYKILSGGLDMAFIISYEAIPGLGGAPALYTALYMSATYGVPKTISTMLKKSDQFHGKNTTFLRFSESSRHWVRVFASLNEIGFLIIPILKDPQIGIKETKYLSKATLFRLFGKREALAVDTVQEEH